MQYTSAILALFASLALAQNHGGPCKFTAFSDVDCKGSSHTDTFGHSANCFNTEGRKSFRVDGCDLSIVSPAQNKYCNPRQGKEYSAEGGKCVTPDLNQLTGHKFGGVYVYELNGPNKS